MIESFVSKSLPANVKLREAGFSDNQANHGRLLSKFFEIQFCCKKAKTKNETNTQVMLGL